MKKGLLFMVVALLATNFAFGQAQRTVLVEEFTQASCGPCAAQNPAFNQKLADNVGKVISIKYQTWWPGYDPMYNQNKADVDIRVPYYGAQLVGVPYSTIDGTTMPNDCGAYEGSPACFDQTKLDARWSVPSPIELSVTHTISADLKTVSVTMIMKNVSAASFGGPGTAIQLVAIEDQIDFPTAPGSNGETTFYNVMRKMYPDANGTDMPLALPPGQAVTQTFTLPLSDYFYNYQHVAFVAFVQDVASKEVHQAALSVPVPLVGYPDVSWTRNTSGPTTICEYEIQPSLDVKNEDATPVTAFTANVWQNGSIVGTKNWTGNLAQGETATVNFDPIELPGIGEWQVDYNLSDLNNGAADYNQLNNLPEPIGFSTVSKASVGTAYTTDFEGLSLGDIPSGSVRNLDFSGNMLTVNTSDGPSTLTKPIGGFTLSDGALLTGFYNMSAGTEAEFIVDKLDFTGKTGMKVWFDRAYRQYQAENDRLKIEVSADCGTTWSTIFNKAGSALKTTTAATAFFYPQTAAQWKKDSAALGAAFDGKSDVLVKFHAISAFGNNLWLDNIRIDNVGTVATSNPALEAATALVPNPTNDHVAVELNLPEAMNLSVFITDLAGRKVATLASNQSFAAGFSQLDFDQFTASGTYFVQIVSEKGQTTKRLTVLK